MATIQECKGTIAQSELTQIEDIAFATMQMDREQVMEDFDDVYEATLASVEEAFECKFLYRSFAVESLSADGMVLENGIVIESPFLAKMLGKADEVVMYAVTVEGYENLANNPANDLFENTFYRAWGVGFSMAAHAWLKRVLAEKAHENGRFVGRGWAPGEGNVEPKLQTVLLNAIDSPQIGLTFNRGNMRPAMSITGFMGVSKNPEIETEGAGEVSYH